MIKFHKNTSLCVVFWIQYTIYRKTMQTLKGDVVMEQQIQIGWQGRFYEDFEVGDKIAHALGRTISQTDNSWFTQLTQNTNPIHFDHHYAKQTEFQKAI